MESILLTTKKKQTWSGTQVNYKFKKSKFKSMKNINPGSSRAVFRVEK